ncbi:hypothetical protein, partial [Nostoc sp.]|uniref:hypothetical protein n=1 Tax=Nostoc sp. TaxID=1180 RepID=UPI002FF95470
ILCRGLAIVYTPNLYYSPYSPTLFCFKDRSIVLTVIIPWFAIAPLSFIPGINQLLFLLYLCLIAFAWAGLIQRILEVGDIKTALRLEFNKALDLGSFNLDDVAMFIKSTLHTTVTSIRDVLKQEGLPVETLDAFVQNINNQTFTGSVGGVTGTGVIYNNVNPPASN